jgi:hypothetical protein
MTAITTTTVTSTTALVAAERVDVDALVHAVAEEGVARHTARILGVVLEARGLGVDADLLAVLGDETESEIVRMRVLGMVAAQVESLRAPAPHAADILVA